jgi:hypothetical protein
MNVGPPPGFVQRIGYERPNSTSSRQTPLESLLHYFAFVNRMAGRANLSCRIDVT